MSDFLFQLADRALAHPPIVRPRAQSIYESPAAPAFGNPVEEHLEVPAEPRHVFEPARERRVSRGDEEPRPEQASAEMDRKLGTPPEQKTRVQAPSPQPRVPQWDEPRPAPLSEPIAPQGTIRAAERETPPQQTARKEERRVESVALAPAGQPVNRFEQERTVSSDHSVGSDLVAPRPAPAKDSPAPQIFVSKPKALAKNPASQPKGATPQAARRPSKEQPPPTFPLTAVSREVPPIAAAPSVHVTIGRVEIRAVLPQASEPRSIPAPSSTRLSLDEYLKRNAGVSR